MLDASSKLRGKWANDVSSCPEEIRDLIKKKYPGYSVSEVLGDMKDKNLLSIIQGSSFVLHENSDLVSVSLVSRTLHDKANGYHGASHMGGAALEAYIKNHYGVVYFETFVNAASTGLVIANGGD